MVYPNSESHCGCVSNELTSLFILVANAIKQILNYYCLVYDARESITLISPSLYDFTLFGPFYSLFDLLDTSSLSFIVTIKAV